MSKEELFKKYQEIVLKTNGGADDYVVALCQISDLINDYAEEKSQQICDLEAKLAKNKKWLASNEGFLENQQLKQQLAESETQLKEEIEEKNGVRRALTACNRQNDEFADMIKKLENEKEELKEQLATAEKALELACDYLISNGNEDDELYQLVQNIYDDDEYLATKINYFKTKAKEMLENE